MLFSPRLRTVTSKFLVSLTCLVGTKQRGCVYDFQAAGENNSSRVGRPTGSSPETNIVAALFRNGTNFKTTHLRGEHNGLPSETSLAARLLMPAVRMRRTSPPSALILHRRGRHRPDTKQIIRHPETRAKIRLPLFSSVAWDWFRRRSDIYIGLPPLLRIIATECHRVRWRRCIQPE